MAESVRRRNAPALSKFLFYSRRRCTAKGSSSNRAVHRLPSSAPPSRCTIGYAHSLDEFIAALRPAMVNAGIDPLGSSAQAEWLRWLIDYRKCVDPFEDLFEEIEKPTPDWYWNR